MMNEKQVEAALRQAREALEVVTKELLAVRDELAERGGRPKTNVFHQRLWDSAFKAYTDHALPAATAIDEALAHAPSVREQPAQQQEPVSDRENSIIRFALHQFMSNAYAHLTAAAQDKEGKRYPSEAVEKFAKDAEDAQALLKRLQFTSPQPSKPWVGLTRKQVDDLADDGVFLGNIYEITAAIEAKLREKNA